MGKHYKAVIVGGGVTGLCALHYLSKELGPEQVHLLEASDYLGGHTRTDRVEGFISDWGPNGFLDKEPRTLQWIEELGLTSQLLRADEASAHRFIYKNGRLIEIKPPPAFLWSGLLSVQGSARLALEPFVPQKADLDAEESIWEFARRRIGREAADTLVSCMVSGVFGGDAKKLSLRHCFPRMEQLEREHGGLVRALLAVRKKDKSASAMGPKGVLTSFQKGIGYLAEQAAEKMSDSISAKWPVAEVSRSENGFALRSESGDSVETDHVVLACTAYSAATMLKRTAPEASDALDSIPYAGLAVVCTGYRREDVGHDLNGFGFLAPRGQGVRMLGCIWTSSVFPTRRKEGFVQLRTMFGGAMDPEAVLLKDEALLGLLDEEVHPLLMVKKAPEYVRIFKHPRGIPQYTLDHGKILKTLDATEETLKGLHFVGNAYRGVSLNDCVVSAHRAVERVLA